MHGYLVRVAKPRHKENKGRHPTLKDGGTVVLGLRHSTVDLNSISLMVAL
jgi:hypothetical protein